MILVTGFEAFGGDAVNPTAELARGVDGMEVERWLVVGRVLPVVFGEAEAGMIALVEEWRPRVVAALGVAVGREAITPERVAINLTDARITDNCGNQPLNTPVVEGGPVGYWSTLPVDDLVAAVRAEGIAARGSLSAGSFVCNAVFYALRHHLRRRRGLRAGFVHVPGLPEQAGEGRPAMDMATQRRALGAMLRVLAD